ERWIVRIRGVAGVERADPYIVGFGQMKMPDGRSENILVVGYEPASPLGKAWSMAEGNADPALHPDGILIDAEDAVKLGNCRIGDVREINSRRAKVVGMTRGIVGFTTNAYVF